MREPGERVVRPYLLTVVGLANLKRLAAEMSEQNGSDLAYNRASIIMAKTAQEVRPLRRCADADT